MGIMFIPVRKNNLTKNFSISNINTCPTMHSFNLKTPVLFTTDINDKSIFSINQLY